VRRLLVLALLLVPVLAGCGGSARETATRGNLTRPELAWIRSYVEWSQAFQLRQGATPGTLPTNAAARRTLAPYRNCERSFGRDVAAPPTRRLLPAAALQTRACAAWLRYADATTRFLHHDFSAGLALQSAQARATHAQLLANDVIDRRLRESRPLPRRTQATSYSRIDAHLAHVVTQLTSIDAEVRCWSADDWPHVLSEAAAYTSVDGREEGDVLAFTSQVHNRINLGPTVCAPLDAFAYDGARPTAGLKAAQVADAVYVLAHESAHLSGIGSEQLASCSGIQDTARVARLLGARAGYAQGLAAEYWRDQYTRQPPRYLTVYCGQDRPLDRSPGDGVWP
jgi:hypothetical protein